MRRGPEAVIETQIRIALNQQRCMVMKNRIESCYQCGAKPKRTDALGLGSADLIVVVPPLGRLLAVEVKAPKGVVSPEQTRWLEQVNRFGAVGGVARSVEAALELLGVVRRVK